MKPSRRCLASLLCVLACAGGPAWADEHQAPQVTVAVEIVGVDGDPERSNVEAWLGYSAAAENQALTEARAKSLHAGAAKAIVQALEPYGYYNAKVTGSELRGQAPDFTARYSVDLGEPVRWIEPDVLVEGGGLQAGFLPKLLEDRSLRIGRRLRHADYEAFKARLVTAAREDGYRDATLSRNLLAIDPKALTAQARLTISTGPRYFFGPTRFTGPVNLREDLLRRYLRYHQGEPYSPQKLLDSQFALNDLDYFEQVQFNPEPELADRQVPITVSLTPRKNRRDSVGLGYGTDTGARGSLGTEVRRLNRQGHKLNAEIRVSEKLTGVSAEWRIPQGNKPGEYLSFYGDAKQEKYSSKVSTQDYKLGTALNRTLGSWKRRYYLEFTRSITSIGYSAAATKAGQRLAGETTVLVPGISFTKSELNDPINTTRGWSLFLDGHGAQEGLLSDVSFLQGRALLRGVYPLPQRFLLSGRAELGGTVVKGFAALPLEQRFFAGGDDSVRGYGYRTLGVKDIDGNNLGGRFLTVGSLELERSIKGPYGAAVFWDFGGVSDTPMPTLHQGVGIGFRYRAPFGAVRVDLAHPLDSGAPLLHLHLGVRVGL